MSLTACILRRFSKSAQKIEPFSESPVRFKSWGKSASSLQDNSLYPYFRQCLKYAIFVRVAGIFPNSCKGGGRCRGLSGLQIESVLNFANASGQGRALQLSHQEYLRFLLALDNVTKSDIPQESWEVAPGVVVTIDRLTASCRLKKKARLNVLLPEWSGKKS